MFSPFRVPQPSLSIVAAALSLLCAGCSRDDVERRDSHAPTAAQRVAAALPLFRDPPPPESEDALVERAARLLVAGRPDRARALLEPIVRARPRAARATFLLALCHHKEKRYAEARPLFEAVLERGAVFDRATSVFYFYGWCLHYLGEEDGARAAFEAALEFDPDERDAWFGLGLVAAEQGRLDEAERDFRRSLELAEEALEEEEPRSPAAAALRRDLAKAHAGLADVFEQRGELERAREELRTCVELHPDAYEAWHRLSLLLDRLGDPEGADAARRAFHAARRRMGREP